MLRGLVTVAGVTPSLDQLSLVAAKLARAGEWEEVVAALALAKAAGYDLSELAATEPGRAVLAAGVEAAGALGNVPLVLRLLQAAAAADCSPETGDLLVCSLSPAVQRAALEAHSRAISTAVLEANWQLAAKLLALMLARGLRPNEGTFYRVLALCAAQRKSKRAARVLLDWAEVAAREQGGRKKSWLERPGLKAFNTVLNACEVCGETTLTQVRG